LINEDVIKFPEVFFFTGIKQLGHEADYIPPPSA